MNRFHLAASAFVVVLLGACGGGGDDGPKRGRLLETPTAIATLTAAQIDAQTAGENVQSLTGTARCDVKVVGLDYATVGAHGEKTNADGTNVNASGVLLMPAGACASTPAPLVAYAKGTDVQKPRTLANPQDPETFTLIAYYASQGYAVVATDYLGYARSTYPFHPYLHADSEASAVIDSVRAARNALASVGGSFSGKVMFTGYSQGGHSSMAAQRAAERIGRDEFDVAGGAHLAGPYDLSNSFKSADLNNPILGYQFFVPFIVTAWQKVYGNVYNTPSDVFNDPYAGYIETLLPSPDLNYTTLVTSGKLPGGTAKQAQDAVFKLSYLQDAKTNPNNGLYVDAQKNDLLGWTPTSPVMLCGGSGDPTVLYQVHQVPMKADFDARGVTGVTSIDVDPSIRQTFGPGGVAPTDPTSQAYATYYGNYHGGYEPLFCHAAAKQFFDGLVMP